MGVGFQLLERAGRLIEHGVGILLLAWRRVIRAALVGGLVGIVLAEITAAIVTRQVPPGIPAQVAALVFGVALAYAAGLTMLADELLRGAIDTVRLLEGDVEAGARAAAIVAEREVGEVRLGLARRRTARRTGQASTTAPGWLQSSADDADAVDSSAETLDAIAATDEFTSTAPRPRVDARPVRADQLPRIPWTYEQRPDNSPPPATAETTEDAETLASLAVPDVDPLPPLPLKPASASESQVEFAGDADPADAPARRAPFIVTLAPQAPAAQPPAPPTSEPQPPAPGPAATETQPPEARVVPVVSQPHAAADAQSHPADAASPSPTSEPRGVWSRISQALVGNTLAEPAEWTNPTSGDGSPISDIPLASSSDTWTATHEAE